MPAAMTDDGTSISYESAGEGPPNLLCLHGWAGSGRYFDATLEQLDLTRARAVTFDLRGHGRSGPAADGFTLDRIAADALAVADAAGPRRVRRPRLQHERQVRAVPRAGRARARRRPDPRRGLPRERDPAPRRAHRRLVGREGDATRMAEIASAYASNPIAPELLERFGEDAATIGRAALEGTLDAACATSFMDRVGAITAPALVVGGRHDAMFTPELLREAVAGPLPGARLRCSTPARGRDRAAGPARGAGRGVPRRPRGPTAGARGRALRARLGAKPGSLLPSGG